MALSGSYISDYIRLVTYRDWQHPVTYVRNHATADDGAGASPIAAILVNLAK